VVVIRGLMPNCVMRCCVQHHPFLRALRIKNNSLCGGIGGGARWISRALCAIIQRSFVCTVRSVVVFERGGQLFARKLQQSYLIILAGNYAFEMYLMLRDHQNLICRSSNST